jgi:RNA polymerase-binding transcription factor DksA
MLASERKPPINMLNISTLLPDSGPAAVDGQEAGRSKELQPCESFHEMLGGINAAPQESAVLPYGCCRQCGERIESERLAENPAALVCLSCETAVEIDHTLRSASRC